MNTKTAACALFSALTLTSCATAITGVPISPLTDPARIGGVLVTAVESGLRPDAPRPTVEVFGTDHGRIDRLGAAAVSDVERFWSAHVLPGGAAYTPVSEVTSWDSRTGAGVTVCKRDPTVNAAFCTPDRTIGWDRGHLMPVLVRGMGDLGAVLVIAHEVGHSVDAQTRGATDPKRWLENREPTVTRARTRRGLQRVPRRAFRWTATAWTC